MGRYFGYCCISRVGVASGDSLKTCAVKLLVPYMSDVIKEFEPTPQAPFYLHKYSTWMGIGWKFAPTEIESEEKDLEHCVPGRFLYRIEWIEILFAIC